jgi:hypothetical protein
LKGQDEEQTAEGQHEFAPSPSPPDALAKVVVLLRRVDDELASLRHEASPGRLLTIPRDVPDLDLLLGPIEAALEHAVGVLGLQAQQNDMRSRIRGCLYILWADLVEVSPEGLRKHWGVRDIPPGWQELQSMLLVAVEGAIAQLGR